MTQRKLCLSALLLLSALPLGASAAKNGQAPADTPVQTTPFFEQLDANRDGFVTLEEARRSADITARFKDLDANRDARISADEFRKGMQIEM